MSSPPPPPDEPVAPMPMPMPAPVPDAGWHADPQGRYDFRYHNGAAWTNDVSHDGRRFVDGVDAPSAASASHHDRSATVALALSIVGLCLSWMPVFFVVGAGCAVAAIVLGVRAHRRRPRDTRGFTNASILIGAAALVVCAVGVWLTTWVVGLIRDYEDPPASEVEGLACVATDREITVSGQLTNTGDRASKFRVVVAVGDGDGRTRDVAFTINELAPGADAEFGGDVEAPTVEAGTVIDGRDCRLLEVTGPLPLGIEV